ncbi:hypothetical protein BKA65DRAFT_537080 [Rhexocercosporidium sp. MPI-PUGE-AT-0058]|nr:hypothetical protein BKA65DRAFT_537080 [Rhexocercosporidium sp. MPI-PUGE-AT-0058]
MSSVYSGTSISSSSIHSDSTTNLPRICDDSDCLYPFGPVCIACSFALDVKERAKRRARPQDRTDEWVEEVQVNRHIVLHAGEEFTGGADETNGPISDIKEEVEPDGEVSEGEPDDEGYEADIEEEVRSDSPISTILRSCPQATYSGTSSSSRTASSSSVALDEIQEESERLSPWLDTIFDNTLHGQVENVHFAGGADVEQDPNLDNCEFCGRPIGEATDQHYLKCKYAHEELERVSKWGSAWGA